MQYEILFLIGQTQEANLASIEKEVESILTQNGAVLVDDRWEEKRKLAYLINKETRGTYIARRFEFPKNDMWEQEGVESKDAFVAISKSLRLNQSLLRFIIVRADELSSLKDFSIRKEELKNQQIEQKRQTTKEKRSTKEAYTPRVEDKNQKTGSAEEINEKLDEILNM